MASLVCELSRGRHFPRSRTGGFVVRCQLVGQDRSSQCIRGTTTPFWGDIFSWDLSPTMLKQLMTSPTSLKLQVVMVEPRGRGPPVDRPLGHVFLRLKGVRAICCRPPIHTAAVTGASAMRAVATRPARPDVAHAQAKRSGGLNSAQPRPGEGGRSEAVAVVVGGKREKHSRAGRRGAAAASV